MLAQKSLAEIAAYSVAMALAVGLCLWVLLGPLHIDRYLGAPIPEPKPERAAAAVPAPVSKDAGVTAVVPAPPAKADPEPATVPLFPGDDGHLLAQLRGALAAKGYWVGAADADANDNTLTALEAFQDHWALPVQPKCDPQCRSALGLPDLR
jgi:hypothetical protein